MVWFSSSWHRKWEHDKDPFVALTSQIKLEESPDIRQAVYPTPSHNTQEHGSRPHHKMTYSLTLALGNGLTTTKGLSHRTPINKHLLNIKVTGNYRIVNFLFQKSQKDSGCANIASRLRCVSPQVRLCLLASWVQRRNFTRQVFTTRC